MIKELMKLIESKAVVCRAYHVTADANAACYNQPMNLDVELKSDDITLRDTQLNELNETLAKNFRSSRTIEKFLGMGCFVVSVTASVVGFDVADAIANYGDDVNQDEDQEEHEVEYSDLPGSADINYTMKFHVVLGPNCVMTEELAAGIADDVGGFIWGQYAETGGGYNVEFDDGHTSTGLHMDMTHYAMLLATGKQEAFNKDAFMKGLLARYKHDLEYSGAIIKASLKSAREAGYDLPEFKSLEKSIGGKKV